MYKSSRKQLKSDEKINLNYFSWTDDEVELLLNVTMDYGSNGRKGTVTEITCPFDVTVFGRPHYAT